jgi:hypothetical protein
LDCRDGHTWGTWTTEEIVNAAGDRMFVLQRKCFACPAIDQEPMAIVEPRE